MVNDEPRALDTGATVADLVAALGLGPRRIAVEVNRAVATAMAEGVQEGLEMLLRFESQADGFYPYHAARADLLRRTNQRDAAADAYERAVVLCNNTAERAYLQRRLDEMLRHKI